METPLAFQTVKILGSVFLDDIVHASVSQSLTDRSPHPLTSTLPAESAFTPKSVTCSSPSRQDPERQASLYETEQNASL